MTIEQLSEQALWFQQIQIWVTAAAIFLGPLAGVIFTLWFQQRKERREAKLRLYLLLLAERKNLPISITAFGAMNQIDVVFNDDKVVREQWQKYYGLLGQPYNEDRHHTWLELLTAMGNSLGFKNISQTTLDKFYVPQAHVDKFEFDKKVAEQWLRVLENTEKFVVETRKISESDNKEAG